MKKCLLLLLLLLNVVCYAQAPLSINFQAVIRNDAGEILTSQALVLQVGLKSNPTAIDYLYQESHNVQSNSFGQVAIKVGQGTVVSGSFASIDWSTGTISFEAIATVSGTEVVVSQQQLSSVPYALFATQAQSLSGPDDIDNTNEIQSLELNGTLLEISGHAGTIDLAALLDNTDAQTLTLENNGLAISGGNIVDLAGYLDNTDGQTLTWSNNNLSISGGNSVNLSSLIDADSDPENEIQHLSVSGSALQLSQSGNTVNLGPYLGTNTDEQDLQLNSNTLSLTNDPSTIDLTPYLQNAQQVPFSNTSSGLTATTVQSALDEIVAEDINNLQEAYAGGSAVQLNGTNELLLTTSTAQPILSTSNSLAGIGVGVNTPLHKFHSEGTTNLTAHPSLDAFETLTGNTYEVGEIHSYTEGTAGSHTNIGTVVSVTGQGINFGTFSTSSGNSNQNVGSYGFASGSIAGTNMGLRGRTVGVNITSSNYGSYSSAEGAGAFNVGARGSATGSEDSNSGVRGETNGMGDHNHGILGIATGTGAGINYGIYGQANGAAANYGVYGQAAAASNSYAGYFQGNVRTTGSLEISSGSLRNEYAPIFSARDESVYAGVNAGLSNVGGSYRNVGVGQNALEDNTTGADNIAIGAYSQRDNVDGGFNVSIGSFAAASLTSSNYNVAIGMSALSTVTGGSSNNVAIGNASLAYTAQSVQNVALGSNAMAGSDNAGEGNVAIGHSSMSNQNGGNDNVVIGRNAGGSVDSDNSNVLIGASSNIVGDVQNSVAIGYQATVSQNNAIVLGDSYNANIRVGIGTNTPSEKLHVAGNALVSGIVTTTSVTETSDKRLKENIKALDINTVIEVLASIDAYQYTWKADSASASKRLQYGVIAQEVEKILPHIVHTDAKGFKSVNYTALIPFLLEAVKAQQAKIETLEAANNELTNTLKNDLAALAAEVKGLHAEKQPIHTQNTDHR